MLPLGLPYISTLVSQLSTSLTCGLSILDLLCLCLYSTSIYASSCNPWRDAERVFSSFQKSSWACSN